MNISDSERQNLRQVLTGTKAYMRAKTQVLENVSVVVVGSNRPCENIGLDLAFKEGMQAAFIEMEKLTEPETRSQGSVSPKVIDKTSSQLDTE